MDKEGTIQELFEKGEWGNRFDDEERAVGRRLRGRVRHLQAAWDGEGDEKQLVLTATIGENQCEVFLWQEGAADNWIVESECDCGDGNLCTHAAAILWALEKTSLRQRVMRQAQGWDAGITRAKDLVSEADNFEEQIIEEPRFVLQISREDTRSRVVKMLLQALKQKDLGEWVVARPMVYYGEHKFALSGKLRRNKSQDGKVYIQRNTQAEELASAQLQQIGLQSLAAAPEYKFLLALEAGGGWGAGANKGASATGIWFPQPGMNDKGGKKYWPWLRAIGADRLVRQGWEVEFKDDVGHDIIAIEPSEFQYALEDGGGDWFRLSVGFEVDGERFDLLPILAQMIDRGVADKILEGEENKIGGKGWENDDERSFLFYLDDGRAVVLSVERMRDILHRFSALLDPRRFQGGKLKIHALDVVQLDEQEPGIFAMPQKLIGLKKLLNENTDSAQVARMECEIPTGLQATLRDYQRVGFEWMQFLAKNRLSGILADDMGLGKTIQTLAHILAELESPEHKQGEPVLVVAPTSVVPNWRAEARKFAPSLKVLVLSGPQRKSYFRSIPYADIVLTSYALLQRDIDDLEKHAFHLAVLDEAQYIKNPDAKVSRAACRLQAKSRLCLSGTPVENHLGELWSQMHFLLPGFLGEKEEFSRSFRRPIEDRGDEEKLALLKERLQPLILRRTKNEVAKELPPKTQLVHPVELNLAQKDLYETVRAAMDKRVRQAIARRGVEGSGMLFLEALLKLRQICCDPQLLKFPEKMAEKSTAKSAKLEYLLDMLDSLLVEGRRVLLFSQFTSMLDIIAEELQSRRISYLMLTGDSKDRGALVEQFQSGRSSIFLISLKAGGTGLNLTAADTVIHYDPWWNPAAEAQATDRAYRIGQTQPVFVHKLICMGTVEERIHQLQQKKSQLADNMLSEEKEMTENGKQRGTEFMRELWEQSGYFEEE